MLPISNALTLTMPFFSVAACLFILYALQQAIIHPNQPHSMPIPYYKAVYAVWTILLLIWELFCGRRLLTAIALPQHYFNLLHTSPTEPFSTAAAPYLAYPLSCTLLE